MRLAVISVAVLTIAASTGAFTQERQERLAPPTSGRPSTDGSAAIPQAPTGHRQPRMSDLPPDVAEQQRPAEPPGSDGPPRANRGSGIDPQLRICRGC
jgi:hypothetical protein